MKCINLITKAEIDFIKNIFSLQTKRETLKVKLHTTTYFNKTNVL